MNNTVRAFQILAALLSTAASTACGGHPSDARLEKRFLGHRASFEALRRMSDDDSQYLRIASDFAQSRDGATVDLPPQRWKEYRRLFRDASLEDGIGRTP